MVGYQDLERHQEENEHRGRKRARSGSSHPDSPSKDLTLKIRKVGKNWLTEANLRRLELRRRKQQTEKMTKVDKCKQMYCDQEISGEDERDFNAKMIEHLRTVHRDQAKERDLVLQKKQHEIFEQLAQTAQAAKTAGLPDSYIQGFMINSGGYGNGGSISLSKEDFPEWVKDQTFNSWKAEFDKYFETSMGKFKGKTVEVKGVGETDPPQVHDCAIRLSMEEKIRQKLVAMLKKCENETVKEYFGKSIMNNEEAKETFQTIIDKLEDRFGVSQKINEKIALEEFHNFEYIGQCTDILDKLERLRKKLHKTITTNSVSAKAEKNVFDKLIWLDFLNKMNALGRLKSDEYRKLESEFITKKYEWAACKKLVRDVGAVRTPSSLVSVHCVIRVYIWGSSLRRY